MADSPDVPSWVTLAHEERVVWSSHPSLRSFGWEIGAAGSIAGLGLIGVLVFTGLLHLLSFIPLCGGLGLLGRLYLGYVSITYVLTTDQFYKKTGLLSRTVTQTRLNHVQHTAFTQSFFQRLLKYGTVEIATAGTDGIELVLPAVSHPDQQVGLLTTHLGELSQHVIDS